MTDPPSAITWVHVQYGSDGKGYFTAMYANNEPGPRSQGYVGEDRREAIGSAVKAAERDFPGLPIKVDPAEPAPREA